jgi:hypothetical protein
MPHPEDRPDIRDLVRRDIAVAGVGAVLGVLAWFVLVLSALDVVGRRAGATTIVALATVSAFGCFVWWLAGPRELRRDRFMVLTPIFLVAVPGVVSLNRLGGGVTVVLISSLVGFSAAVAAGLALASRRAR